MLLSRCTPVSVRWVRGSCGCEDLSCAMKIALELDMWREDKDLKLMGGQEWGVSLGIK